MDSKVMQATIVVVVIVAGTYAGLVYMGWLGPNGPSDLMQITSIEILANTTDILCPELMEAKFTPQFSGAWQVSASFLNDSLGPYNATAYDKDFVADANETGAVVDALYSGLNRAGPSNDSVEEALNNTSIAFAVLISYRNGTWINIFALLNTKGHLIVNIGQGESNKWSLTGIVLESWSVFDEFIQAVNQVFSNHIS